MKYKKPLIASGISKKPKSTQQTISQFHLLNEKKQRILQNASLSEKERTAQIEACEAEQDKLGGLPAYQLASLQGSKLFNTCKWLIKELKSKRTFKSNTIRLLDVGALTLSYKKYTWIDATYIDLHPQLPSIKKADLLEFTEPDSKFDIVALALVLNFEASPTRRFSMLKKASSLLTEEGMIYIVLPVHCLSNSSKIGMTFFASLMRDELDLNIVAWHTSPKLVFILLSKCGKQAVKVRDLAVDSRKGINCFDIIKCL
jgi:25S rRNA (adenine2142-N1)-methyltransferase